MTSVKSGRSTTSLGPRPAAIWVALLLVYVVWGSTYLGIRVLVGSAPPLLSMGTRYFAAGILLAGYMCLRHGRRILHVTRRQVVATAVVGGLLLLGGNGGVAIAEQVVPSGLAALIVAATPLWLVCLRTVTGDRPRALTLVGTLLGFAGIALLVLPGRAEGAVPTWGLVLVLCACFCWAVGSFLSSRLPVPGNPFVASVWEMLLGAALLLGAGVLRGELRGFALADVSRSGRLAWLYLVLIGSLVGFSAYAWLLENAPISLTATYAYVNPVVAVLLGAALLAEPVTATILAGGAVVVLGVFLVVSTERPRQQPAAGEVPEPAQANPGR